MTNKDRGDQTLTALVGADRIAAVRANLAAFDPDLETLVCDDLLGRTYSRPGLDLRTRSIATISALIALARTNQLEFHMRAGLRLGVTETEIKELILQLAYYAGAPCALEAIAALKRAKDNPG